MKKILVPIDFSPSARNAAAYSANLVKAFDAEMELLHVYAEPVSTMEGAIPSIAISQQLHHEFDSRVDKEVELLREKYGVQVNGDVMVGFRSDAIHEMADDMMADLVVMGKIAEKENLFFGSTILKTIRKTDIPVLVIPEGVAYTPPKRIVLAVDFKEMVYTPCLDLLFQLVKKFDASLSVLHIQKKGTDAAPEELPEKLQLGKALAKVTYYYDKVEAEDIEGGITRFLNNHPTDMLVMIAHHHNFFERLFGTIHTRSLGLHTQVPLLVLKNQDH